MARRIGFRIAALLVVWCCVLGLAGAGRKGRCEVCKNFVKAFEEGLKSTENSNFAGGDTRWEEEKLGSYANSEVRFVEILDGVCNDYECHTLLEENEEHIERWWFKLRHKKPDLKLWLCHSQLDVCCPENTFGPSCQECPGGIDNPCGGQGTCEGVEEKDGTGKCRCNRGYHGDGCGKCDKGFYNESSSSSCEVCHRACLDDCTGGGAGDCLECGVGYSRSEEGAECKDVNECEEREMGGVEGEGGGEGETPEPLCEEGKYCFNTPGSYRCNDCDRSCEKSCSGPGPAKCHKCGTGYYTSQFNVCRDINECEGGEGWEGDPITCKGATFCENSPGSYQCKACHVACLDGCRGAGPTKCADCKEGFNMDDGECKDVNECEEETTCDADTETCSNLIGSFKCKCKPGLVRVEGKCTEKVVREREQKKKTKKKKKKAKKGASGEGVKTGADGEERETQPVTAELGEEREGEGVREGRGGEVKEGEGVRKERGGEVKEGEGERERELLENEEGKEGMVAEEPGSRDTLSHDGSHDQPQQASVHEQNPSHDQQDKSRDASRDKNQSGQSAKAVDLQDTHEEL